MKLLNPKDFVKEYSIKSLAACFSGGKDSLVSTHFVMSELEGEDDIDKHVVFVDTGAMLPISEPFVRDVCQQYGWNLTVLNGGFFEKAKKFGMPRMRHRWCCYECKLKPIIEFVKPLKPQRGEVIGLRRDESPKRQKITNMVIHKKQAHSWGYAPILFWTEKQVLQYIKDHDLPSPPHYKLGLKETCQCGVFSSKRQMLILKAQFPDLFQKFVRLEKEFRKGGAAFYFRGKATYARDLAKQKTIEEWTK